MYRSPKRSRQNRNFCLCRYPRKKEHTISQWMWSGREFGSLAGLLTRSLYRERVGLRFGLCRAVRKPWRATPREDPRRERCAARCVMVRKLGRAYRTPTRAAMLNAPGSHHGCLPAPHATRATAPRPRAGPASRYEAFKLSSWCKDAVYLRRKPCVHGVMVGMLRSIPCIYACRREWRGRIAQLLSQLCNPHNSNSRHSVPMSRLSVRVRIRDGVSTRLIFRSVRQR